MSLAVLGDRYRPGERIADGGMGSVYRAVDESLGRPVAVKVLRRELAGKAFIVMELVEGETLAPAERGPGVPEPLPRIPGPPNREGSPTADPWLGAIHSPPAAHSAPAAPSSRRPRRRGWRWRRSS